MTNTTRDFIAFSLNGLMTEVRGDDALLNLSDYLRKRRAMTGSKIVCAEGDCGACSVLRAYPKPGSLEVPEFEVINSCIARVAQLDGSFVVTIEGIAKDDELDPIQEAMVECNASQCGFCTPGFVMALSDHFETHTKEKSPQNVKNALTGNLCRCTGYQAIVDAALHVKRTKAHQLRDRYVDSKSLEHLRLLQKQSVAITGTREKFFAPSDLTTLAQVRSTYPQATMIAAGTDLGVQKNKHGKKMPALLSLHLIEELFNFEIQNSVVSVGARVTLSELREGLKESNSEIANFLNVFASPQIKNFGTLIGNVANGSPIADTPPFLLALDADIHLWNPQNQQSRTVKIVEFYLGYKKLNLLSGEIIFKISFRLPEKNDKLYLKKISQRRDLDISTINTAFLYDSKNREYRLAVGGVAATPFRLRKTEKLLSQATLSTSLLEKALKQADLEVNPLSDLRGTSAYRRLVLQNLLRDYLSTRIPTKPRSKHVESPRHG